MEGNGNIITWTDGVTTGTYTLPGIYDQTIPVQEIRPEIISPLERSDSILLNTTEVFEMQVYDVIVVDTKECEVLHRQEVIAEDEKIAMLELDVTPEIKKLQKKGRVKFIFNQIGGFNRYTRKVQIKEEEE
ncbi:hypothetical protein LCGC14_1628670 [marine sediment metagenome]|uniref:Uncharacterized protein n=1 Tax=marine sediment metagenome TaxID=412755 RepID=A0A0F9I3C4_9ZZZZ